MKVTLKKASELSRALIAASKTAAPNARVSISAFSTVDPTEVVETSKEAFFAALARQQSLVRIAYDIRAAIAVANEVSGVSGNLTRVAAIDEQLLRVTPLLKEETDYFGESALSAADPEALTARVEKARRDAKAEPTGDRYGRSLPASETIIIEVIGEAEKARLKDISSALKRQRSALKDEITAANFKNEITLSDEAIAALRAEKLID